MNEIMIPELARQAAPLLAPYLPYLLKGAKTVGKTLLEGFGKKAGEEGAARAVKLWEQLRPALKDQPEVEKRLNEFAEKPDDPRLEPLVSYELEKLLARLSPDQLTAVQAVVNQPQTHTTTSIASGERSVSAGGSISNSTIITGDSNKIAGRD